MSTIQSKKGRNDKQWLTKTTQKTRDFVTRHPLKTGLQSDFKRGLAGSSPRK